VSSISAFDKDTPVYELSKLSVVSPSFFEAHHDNSFDKVVYAYVVDASSGTIPRGFLASDIEAATPAPRAERRRCIRLEGPAL
jgi:hypothetical protein